MMSEKELYDCLGMEVKELPKKLPIDNTYGLGFEFELYGEKYVTEPETKDGKLVVELHLSTWAGMVSYAHHYFGRLCVRVKNVEKSKRTKKIGGYLGGIEIPKEYKSFEINVGRPLTDEELSHRDDKNSPWFGYAPGIPARSFDSREECINAARRLYDELFDTEKCVLKIIE